jgi:hypothetical protein
MGVREGKRWRTERSIPDSEQFVADVPGCLPRRRIRPLVQTTCDELVTRQQWIHDISAVGGQTYRQIILWGTSLAISVPDSKLLARVSMRYGCASQFWSRLNH